MIDKYILGQSPKSNMGNSREKIKLDVVLKPNLYNNKAKVTGHITDSVGRPIENVLVRVLDHTYNPLYYVITNNEGEYHILNLPKNTELHICAIKSGYKLKEATPFFLSTNDVKKVDLTLETDITSNLSVITGRVVDSKEEPVSNINVVLLRKERNKETAINISSTNISGQFAFVDVIKGNYIIQLSGEGYKTSFIEVIIDKKSTMIEINTAIRELVETFCGTINGVIKDIYGNPVVGATVILYKITGEEPNEIIEPIKQTLTINNGVYLFGQIEVGRYLVKANIENNN
jgi:5-hydroxyisourate hydrolase-like protein (transthyretin family)